MRAGLWFMPLAGVLSLASSLACSNPKPAEVPVSASGDPEASSAEQDAPLDLQPAPAPDYLVGLASFRAPAKSLTTATAWTGLGVDWRVWLESGPAAAFLPVLDLEAPIDLVVTLDPKAKNRPRAFFAVSLGLTSRQAALDTFTRMEMPSEFVEPGVHSVRPSPGTVCFVAAALGPTNARLVCGQDRESLDLLSPYLTRGNPSSRAGDADLHVEVSAEAAYRIYGEKAQFLKLGIPMMLGEVAIGNPDFDEALRAAATALVDEIILELADLGAVRIDAWLRQAEGQAQGELDVKLGIDFRNTKSWMAQALVSAEGNASVAPETYWELPLDATEAVYYSASKPELMQPMLEHVQRLARAGLAHLGASPSVQAEWPASLRELFSVAGPTVSARGLVPAQMLPANPGPRDELRASFGYTVVGVEDEQNRYAKWLEQTLKLYEDTALRKSLASKYGIETAKLPKVQSRKGPAALAGSRVYEIAVPPDLFAAALDAKSVDPKELGGPIPLVIVVGREGSRTWLGFSSYLPVLEQRLTALAAPKPPETSIAQRPGLERLRQEPANVAGFWTLAGFQSGMSLGDDDVRKFFLSLGKSDAPIIGKAVASSKGPRSDIQLHIPSRLFRDVATAVASQR